MTISIPLLPPLIIRAKFNYEGAGRREGIALFATAVTRFLTMEACGFGRGALLTAYKTLSFIRMTSTLKVLTVIRVRNFLYALYHGPDLPRFPVLRQLIASPEYNSMRVHNDISATVPNAEVASSIARVHTVTKPNSMRVHNDRWTHSGSVCNSFSQDVIYILINRLE